MLRIIAAAGGALAFVMTPANAQRGTVGVDPLFVRWNSAESPGCAVGVAKSGRTIFERAYGSADLEHDVPNRPDTIFEAGSVAKQFTAAAILLLVQDGKLSLKDDVRKYVPELPLYPHMVTLEHLLNHTSGLRDWGAVAEISGWPRGSRAVTNADALAIITRQKSLNYAPGSEYSYTNSGYNLLTVIVARVSGSTLAGFARERLFKPLGMANSSWRDDFRRIVKRRAIAYGRRDGAYAQDMPFEDAHGNGGLLTTIGDLLIWNEALANGRLGTLVTTELHRRTRLSNGRTIPYARGVVVGHHDGREEFQHAGATGGYRAWLARYPQEKISVALLCNAGDAAATELGRGVAEQFLAPRPVESPIVRPGNVSARTGSFVNERTGVPTTFVAEGGRLRMQEGPFLDQLSADRFRLGGSEFVFEGEAALLLHSSDGETIRFRRVQPVQPTPQELARLEGTYRSEEADVSYIVTVAGAGLMLQHAHRPTTRLKAVPAYKDAFTIPGGVIRFYRGKGGTATELGIGIARVRDLRFRRIGR